MPVRGVSLSGGRISEPRGEERAGDRSGRARAGDFRGEERPCLGNEWADGALLGERRSESCGKTRGASGRAGLIAPRSSTVLSSK